MHEFFAAIRILRRTWWVAVVVTAAVVAATAVFTYSKTPIYRASTTLAIGLDENLADVSDMVDIVRALQPRSIIATFARLPASQVVRDRAREQLGVAADSRPTYQISTRVLPDTNVLRISVQSPDPRHAAAMANAVARQTRIFAKELYGIFGVRVLDPATEPVRPVRPRVWRSLGSGALVGLFLGVGLAFLIGGLRETWKPSEKETSTTGSGQADARDFGDAAQ